MEGMMDFEEFLERAARSSERWRTIWDGCGIRNERDQCPLEAVFGFGYRDDALRAGLNVDAIIRAADGEVRHGKYRSALLRLTRGS